MIDTVLFDLDGTLLPMDQDAFTAAYFDGITRYLAAYGYDPPDMMRATWAGIRAMKHNDGKAPNATRFWDTMVTIYGPRVLQDKPYFEQYYREAFDDLRPVCGYTPRAGETVAALRAAGCRVAVATNPLFPPIAIERRLTWAGVSPGDLALYTHYENSFHCKPTLAYYQDVLTALDVTPARCLMVGNDVGDDMVAASLGMPVFLLTDCLINAADADIRLYPHGDYDALRAYLAAHVAGL